MRWYRELRRIGRADYGIDAPEGLRNITLGGFGALAAGVLLSRRGRSRASIVALVVGVFSIVCAVLWLASTKIGKRFERDRLLDSLALRGDERVLDAGCGRGLMLLGAAQRLTSGHAVGIDPWTKDQSGNSPTATLANATAVGVRDRVTAMTGDVRWLPFRDGAFDVAVSNLVLDNIHDPEGWTQAMRELARVLQPGGRILVSDLANTEQYEATLREEGWTDVERSGPHFRVFPPVRVVTGSKPS